MYFGMFGSVFLLAQFFQVAQGYTPFQAGLRTLPWTGMPIIVAPIAGILADRIGGRPILATGMALQAVALGWLAAVVTPTVAYEAMVVPFILAGVGMGLFFAPIANVVLSAVRPEEEGKASGATNTIREVGGVFGVAVLAAIFSANGDYTTPGRVRGGSPAGHRRRRCRRGDRGACRALHPRPARAHVRSRRRAQPTPPSGGLPSASPAEAHPATGRVRDSMVAYPASMPSILSHVRAADGTSILVRDWASDSRPGWPWASVLLVHGLGEHSGRYEHVGDQMAAAGLDVHAYDHRGNGGSGGRRGHVDRWEQYHDDLAERLVHVRGQSGAPPRGPLRPLGGWPRRPRLPPDRPSESRTSWCSRRRRLDSTLRGVEEDARTDLVPDRPDARDPERDRRQDAVARPVRRRQGRGGPAGDQVRAPRASARRRSPNRHGSAATTRA